MRVVVTDTRADAGLTLRGPRAFVRPRVRWPVDAPDGSPIAVLLADTDAQLELTDVLCDEGGCVVLAMRTEELDVAAITVEWAAENARSLGADPERLVVAGGRLAAAVVARAREQGWPNVWRLLPVGPKPAAWSPGSLAGVRSAVAA